MPIKTYNKSEFTERMSDRELYLLNQTIKRFGLKNLFTVTPRTSHYVILSCRRNGEPTRVIIHNRKPGIEKFRDIMVPFYFLEENYDIFVYGCATSGQKIRYIWFLTPKFKYCLEELIKSKVIKIDDPKRPPPYRYTPNYKVPIYLLTDDCFHGEKPPSRKLTDVYK